MIHEGVLRKRAGRGARRAPGDMKSIGLCVSYVEGLNAQTARHGCRAALATEDS